MFKPLSLFLAQRYVRSRHGNGFATFISASSTVGIALGVMVLIVVLSAMNGFEKALAERLLSIVPHGELIAAQRPIDNWQKNLTRIEQQYADVAVAPVVKMSGMIQHKTALKGIEVRGVDLHLETKVSAITDYIVAGKWEHLANFSDKNTVVIGAGIAKKLGLSVGDTAQLLLPKNQLQLQSDDDATSGQGSSSAVQKLAQQKFPVPLKQNVEVVAIFKFGGTVDETLAYISLQHANALMGFQSNETQGLRIKVNDVFQAPQIIRDIAYSFDHYVYIYDWTRTQGHLFSDIQLVRVVMFIVLVIVIAVASFNIVSTLIMVVNDKKGDIAILKTMGAKSSDIMLTFMIQGLVNGVLGCLVGGLSGIYLSLHLTDIVRSIEDFFSVNFLSSDVYFIDFLPTELLAQDVYGVLITALVMSFLATIYPAWQATKVEPAQVLGQI